MEGAVKPWEWAEVPSIWLDAALISMKSEHAAREYEQKKAERKAGRARSNRRKR
jgi:hypothetical protein